MTRWISCSTRASPSKKKLLRELGRLTPGEVLQVKIDTCEASRSLVENYVKNKWCRIIKVVEEDDANIIFTSSSM